MSQKEQLAKLAKDHVYSIYAWRGRSPEYMTAQVAKFTDKLEAAFLLGARAMQERIARGLSAECERHEELPNVPADNTAARVIRNLKPEELL